MYSTHRCIKIPVLETNQMQALSYPVQDVRSILRDKDTYRCGGGRERDSCIAICTGGGGEQCVIEIKVDGGGGGGGGYATQALHICLERCINPLTFVTN